MNVFYNVASASDDDAMLVTPARAVAAKTLALSGSPRSLCEIWCDEDDYRWLQEWAGRLTTRHLQMWLFGFKSRMVALQEDTVSLSHVEAAGCLLLLLASESARHEASEGSVWPTVRRQFADPAQRLLFDAQGQPKREFKDSLEGASRKLGLRHLFGVAGTHNYYISVYLQFGFTRKGMERLPHWLAGLPTSVAVSQLLSSADDRGSDRRGESFLSLWDTLRGFRRNNITEANARTRLSRSPWVLPNWVDDLIEQASKSHDIPDREFGLDSVEPIPPVFLADAKLRWDPPANPEFTTAIINLADFDLTSDRYRVMVGDERLATLLRTDGGDYNTRPERVTLPSHAADLTAVLSDDEGHAPASQLLNLWDPDEDVELFDLATGDRIDPNVVQHAPSKNYGLLVSADLMVEPPGLQYRMIGAGNQTKKLYLLSGGHDGLVRVSVPGTPGGDSGLWSLAINGNSLSRSHEPDWAVGLFTSIVPS